MRFRKYTIVNIIMESVILYNIFFTTAVFQKNMLFKIVYSSGFNVDDQI